MPSQILHSLFGEDVIAGIFRRTGNWFETETIHTIYKNVFALGCQGPDIFYHGRRQRPVGLEYGTLLHRRGIGLFAAKLLEASLPPTASISALGAYALGFMTHAILDRAAHPYIVYKSFRPSSRGTLGPAQAHTFFERIIDALMLKTLRGREISGWDQECVLSSVCTSPPPGLKELLERTLIQTFPERAGKDEKLADRIKNTFDDSARFYRLTAPANLVKKNTGVATAITQDHLLYIYPENLPGHIDFLNMETRPWFYPAGHVKEDTRSFPEVYAHAVQAATDLLGGIIKRYLEDGAFPTLEAATAMGNGGLSLVDSNGAPCPPIRFDSLPLDEVLEQQFASCR
jgi:hypothetical protein